MGPAESMDEVGGAGVGGGELVWERERRAVGGCCCRVVRCSYKEWMYGLNLGWVNE